MVIAAAVVNVSLRALNAKALVSGKANAETAAEVVFMRALVRFATVLVAMRTRVESVSNVAGAGGSRQNVASVQAEDTSQVPVIVAAVRASQPSLARLATEQVVGTVERATVEVRSIVHASMETLFAASVGEIESAIAIAMGRDLG